MHNPENEPLLKSGDLSAHLPHSSASPGAGKPLISCFSLVMSQLVGDLMAVTGSLPGVLLLLKLAPNIPQSLAVMIAWIGSLADLVLP